MLEIAGPFGDGLIIRFVLLTSLLLALLQQVMVTWLQLECNELGLLKDSGMAECSLFLADWNSTRELGVF